MGLISIPTSYNGVNFRSRLEAKWAAFFDLNGVDWEYEPVDLAGWIPDFILPGKTDLYVEVKPITAFDVDLFNRLIRYRKQVNGEILILSRTFWQSHQFVDDLYTSGWLIEKSIYYHDAEPDSNGADHEFIWTRNEDFSLDLCHGLYSYHSRRSGYYEGNPVGPLPIEFHELENTWKQAGNVVQWKKAK